MGVRIEKSWYFFGSPIVIYSCPNCEGELKSPVADIGNEDVCPECDCTFVVQGNAEYQAYLDSRKPNPQLNPPTPSHSKYVKEHIKNIAKLEKVKAKALKKRQMHDYTDAVLDQANSYEQIAEQLDDDDLIDEVANANFLKSTIKYIEYEYLLINGAWNAMDKAESVWNKELRGFNNCSAIAVLQPYSRIYDDLSQLEGLFISTTSQLQKSLKCPVSPKTAWTKFSKAMKSEKVFRFTESDINGADSK